MTYEEQNEYIKKLEQCIAELKSENTRLDQQLLLLRAAKFAPKSEKIHPVDSDSSQYLLPIFNEAESTLAEEPAEEEKNTVVAKHTRKKRNKDTALDSLPQLNITLDLPVTEKLCVCGATLQQSGEVVSRKIMHLPSTTFVINYHRAKYVCPNCEPASEEEKSCSIASMPKQVLQDTMATPELLARIAIGKFADALPLYRQREILAREGVTLPSSTLSYWMVRLGKETEPLINYLLKKLRAGPIINMDETPVQVMREDGRANTSKSYMWVGCGGEENAKIRLFRYYPTRSSSAAEDMLADFHGFLQTDGYAAYKAFGTRDGITHVGCLVHVARKFKELLKLKQKDAFVASIVNLIAKVYRKENALREEHLSPEEFQRQRREAITPILSDISKRLSEKSLSTLPSSNLGRAIAYARGQWPLIMRHLDDHRLTPDNNIAENAIRPFAVGRKNWLFAGSPAGAESSAAIFSLIETAKANDVDPWLYLCHICRELPAATSEARLEKLLPWNCAPLVPPDYSSLLSRLITKIKRKK